MPSTWGDEEENKLSYKREKNIYTTFKRVKSCHTWQIKIFKRIWGV